VFGLKYAVLSAEDLDYIDVFGDAILEQYEEPSEESKPMVSAEGDIVSSLGSKLANVSVRAASLASSNDMRLDTRKVVNVLIMKDFNLACHDVQIQTMELVRRRRIFSRTTVHAVSEVFLMLGLVSTSTKDVMLNKHLVRDGPQHRKRCKLIFAERSNLHVALPLSRGWVPES
jgi:hypothetical protein